MKKIILGIIAAAAVGAGVLVATADSKEEKAAKRFAAAQEFVAKGDNPRALIELRNALQADENLDPARLLFADLLLESGRRNDAFAQYRRVVERNPDNIDASHKIALMAFDSMAWPEARRYSDAVLAVAPDDKVMQSVSIALNYREAVERRDSAEMERAATQSRALLAGDASLLSARRTLIADAVRGGDDDRALELADVGLKLNPDDRDLNNARLFVLGRQGKTDEIEQQLLSMVALYPKDEELGNTLIRFYVANGKMDQAEGLLRGRIDPAGKNADARMVLLRFMSEVQGPAAVRDELDKVLAENPLPSDVAANELKFRALRAQTDYILGDRDKGMAGLEGLIKGAEASADVDMAKVQLARMRVDADNKVGARALIEEVLAHDSGQTEALKIKSEWLIEEDQTEQAVSLLRNALSDAPNDAQIMTLLARAYQREGRPELMTDMLARAVEVSNQAPDESLRYARWLLQSGQTGTAEGVLIDALRRQPQNLELLAQLAQTHLTMKDWGRAQQDIDAISERFDSDRSRSLAGELRAKLLAGQGRNDELSALLDRLARDAGNELGARMSQIRGTVANGDLDLALTEAQALVTENPASAPAQMLLAQVQITRGDRDTGFETIRTIVAQQPDYLPGWIALQGQQVGRDDLDGAIATLDGGLKQFPGQRDLLLSKAIVVEKKNDIDGAITIYEDLYKANSDDLIIANNLASLLASTRDDQASLDRAWTVARRLNGTKVPAFQDTYGWIAFRRGDSAVALQMLEEAAKGLPQDPSVAYHLGQVYAAQNRKDEAKAQYDRADALLAEGSGGYPALAQEIVRARSALAQN